MDEYLKETEFCDFSNPEVKEIAERFKKYCKDEKDLATSLFYFVRDKIDYRLGFWNKKASETLNEGAGTCTNASNLLVALLRQAGIPAGYGVAKVKGREYLGVIALNRFRWFVGRQSTHIYAYVYLDGKWLTCDPSNDEALALSTQHINAQSKLVDWDGIGDANRPILLEHIVLEKGPVANIDELIDRKMKLHKILPTKIANIYISFLRESGKNFHNIDIVEREFRRWLWKNHFVYAMLYSLFSIGARNEK